MRRCSPPYAGERRGARDAQTALDEVRRRFGEHAIAPASFLTDE
jgi:hypothetical protein